MSIWTREPDLEALNELGQDCMEGYVGIRFTAVGADFIRATMPVDQRTQQPFGLLHGGASVVLAETLGSTGAAHCIDRETHFCVGLDVNANHVRGVRGGVVTGTAKPLHVGGSTQVWEILIRNEVQQLVCATRLTMAVLTRSRASDDA